jgi:predicted TPR repeat methyltransferase
MARKTIHDALAAHQQGRIPEAESIYLDLLRQRADDVDALHYLGVLRMRQGNRDQAIDFVRRALALAPRNAEAWNNLANMLLDEGDGTAAEAAYLQAINAKPDYAEAWYNLGNLYRRMRRADDALRAYRRTIEIDPRFTGAYEKIAGLLKQMGREDLRGPVFAQWLKADPGNPVAKHMAAAYSAQDVPGRASDAYVTQLFDRYAATFDVSLARLKYSAPSLVCGAVAEVLPSTESKRAVLDAGCGTGLCGPLLRATAASLTGVDLSAGMLAKAAERKVYDELHKGELVAFMREHPAAYDVIVSADTLNYFGALEEAFSAAAAALQDAGVFAFTLEAPPADSVATFKLHAHGRYSHNTQYVRDRIAAAGLELLRLAPGVLRAEGSGEVVGHVVVARKNAR